MRKGLWVWRWRLALRARLCASVCILGWLRRGGCSGLGKNLVLPRSLTYMKAARVWCVLHSALKGAGVDAFCSVLKKMGFVARMAAGALVF